MHEKDCACFMCDAMKEGLSREEAANKMMEQEDKMLKDHGWFTHFVGNDENTKTGLNAHTHGLENYDHLNLQMVFPIEPRVIQNILHNIIARIKDGEKFKHGDIVEKVLGNGYKCKLIETQESGRSVLRLILPDVDGNLDQETIAETFKAQYD